MMIPMVQHDGAEQFYAGFAEEFHAMQRQTPSSQSCLLTHPVKALLYGVDTLVKSGVDLRQIARNGRLKAGLRGIKLVELSKLCQAAWNSRHMKRELPE